MSLQLRLLNRDVTLLGERRRADVAPNDVPEHRFVIRHDDQHGYALDFDGNSTSVPDDRMAHLFNSICDTTPVDWKYSKDTEIQNTFRPLTRIIECLTTTPSYQLFLAGFHLAEAIGMLSPNVVDAIRVPDNFRHLVGTIPWVRGKKGRLFVLTADFVAASDVIPQLVANGKLFEADLFIDDANKSHQIDKKLFLPYATPIGFNTRVDVQTEKAWRDITRFVRQYGGGYFQ